MYSYSPLLILTVIFLKVLVLIGCRKKETTLYSSAEDNASIQFYPGSSAPFLQATERRLLLSWLQSKGDQDSLYLAIYENRRWTNPRLVASGKEWFVNWADFPAIQSFTGSYEHYLLATWLVKSDTAKFSYDILYSISSDLGIKWSPPELINEDGLFAEHGFVSMALINDSMVFIAWLDGRNTVNELTENHEGHGGEMTLRGVNLDIYGHKYDELELDNRVCDCCQTSVAKTEKGLLIAYRDRSDAEIRDIALLAMDKELNISSQVPNPDHWKISGCPVNGPALISRNHSIVYAWYSAPDNLAHCKLSISTDDGFSFSNAIRFDEGRALGRLDLCWLDGNDGLISWMEKNDDQTANLSIKRFNLDGSLSKVKWTVKIPAHRLSGFPKIDYFQEQVFLTWTDTTGALPQVKVTNISVNKFD